MKLRFREGNIDDIEQVFALNRQVFDEAWSKDTMLQSLQVGYDLYVCFWADKLVGYVLSQDILLETQVMQLCVEPKFRRKGIAKKLMSLLINEKSDGEDMILEVRASNQTAQSFYKTLGFSNVGLRKNYYEKTKSCPAEDAVVMVLG